MPDWRSVVVSRLDWSRCKLDRGLGSEYFLGYDWGLFGGLRSRFNWSLRGLDFLVCCRLSHGLDQGSRLGYEHLLRYGRRVLRSLLDRFECELDLRLHNLFAIICGFWSRLNGGR